MYYLHFFCHLAQRKHQHFRLQKEFIRSHFFCAHRLQQTIHPHTHITTLMIAFWASFKENVKCGSKLSTNVVRQQPLKWRKENGFATEKENINTENCPPLMKSQASLEVTTPSKEKTKLHGRIFFAHFCSYLHHCNFNRRSLFHSAITCLLLRNQLERLIFLSPFLYFQYIYII